MRKCDSVSTVLASAVIWAGFFSCVPVADARTLTISEIMYDLSGSDTDREWIEVKNDSGEPVDLTGWKFNDGSNHNLVSPPEKGGQGSLVLPSGAYAIFASDAPTFLAEQQTEVTVIDTVMSLGQRDDQTYTLKIIAADGSEIESVSYTTSLGAKGDGSALQRNSSGWIAASPTPGLANSQTAAPPTEDDLLVGGNQTSPGGAPASAGENTVPPPKVTISAEAHGDRTAITGSQVVFQGKAYGLEGKLIPNARFLWNFGDGAVAEGQSVLHTYHAPGVYLAALEASSGEYSASDRIRVSVIASPITVKRLIDGPDGQLEISNSAQSDIDLSFWELTAGSVTFRLPKNTFITGGGILVLPNINTGLEYSQSGKVTLKYPNGVIATTFTPESSDGISQDSKIITESTRNNGGSERVSNNENKRQVPVLEKEKKNTNEIASFGMEAAVAVAEAVPESSQPKSHLAGWIIAVIGISLLGVVGLQVFRRSQGGASEFTIIEEEAAD